MKKLLKTLIFTAFFLFLFGRGRGVAQDAPVPKTPSNKLKILDIRSKEYSEYIRFVVDISGNPKYRTFILNDPERVVVDIHNTEPVVENSNFEAGKVIDSIRTGRFGDGIRIVLDINVKAKIKNHFILRPGSGQKNHRVVVDISKGENLLKKELEQEVDLIEKLIVDEEIEAIEYADQEQLNDLIGELAEPEESRLIEKPDSVRSRTTIADSKGIKPILRVEMEKKRKQRTVARYSNVGNVAYSQAVRRKKYNIVIDAGHGGKDPGAIGRKRTKEKNITLSYAKILKSELKKTGRYNVFLTRKGDYFVTLKNRVKKARKFKGDLFISIHADSGYNRRASGMSVYTLSQKASDTRTAMLARNENKADIIEGVNLFGEYQDTINILVDLSRREAMNSSSEFAEILLKHIRRNRVRTLPRPHRYGNFAVLLAPDMPSVLIEVGFLSNKANERLLKTWSHKKKIAKGIVESVDEYFGRQ